MSDSSNPGRLREGRSIREFLSLYGPRAGPTTRLEYKISFTEAGGAAKVKENGPSTMVFPETGVTYHVYRRRR